MPPVTRSKCSCSKVKNEVVECPTTFFTTFSEEDIARIEKHQKRVQKYRSETVESGGCDYIPQGDRILVTKTEADDSLEDVFLTPPSSPIVHRSVVLRGCDVLGLWDYLWRTEDNENGAALGRIVKTFENGDLLNKPLVLWLISSMTDGFWEMINTSSVRQFACVAEIEDEITGLLQLERDFQAPDPFDIRNANDMVLTLLSGNIKVLCDRQANFDRAQQALDRARDFKGYDLGFAWDHPSNYPRQVEEREVSPESYELLESCEPNEYWPIDPVYWLRNKSTAVAGLDASAQEDESYLDD